MLICDPGWNPRCSLPRASHGRSLPQRIAGRSLQGGLGGLAADTDAVSCWRPPRSAELARAFAARVSWFKVQLHTVSPLVSSKARPASNEPQTPIAAAQPDILFAVLRHPNKSIVFYEHGLQLSVPFGNRRGWAHSDRGAALFLARRSGTKIACEWTLSLTYRLCREPARMWAPLLICNLEFCGIVLRHTVFVAPFSTLFVHLVTKDRFAAELIANCLFLSA